MTNSFSTNFFPLLTEKLIFVKEKFWLNSIYWDFFWFHSGLWLTCFFLISNNIFFSEIFYIVGVFMFWIAHRFNSFYLAWGTKSFRPICKKQPVRFIILPLLLFIGGFIFIFYIPYYLIPFSVLERIVFLFIIDFFWGAHHFAAQHYGILRLYQNISKEGSSSFSKNADRIFSWGIGGIMVILAEIIHGTSYLQEENIIPYNFSNWFFEEIIFLKVLGILVVFVFTFYMIFRSLIYDSGLPKVLYYLGIGLMVISAFHLEPFQFLMLWTLQHWMVSLGLGSHLGGNDLKKNNKNVLILPVNFSILKFLKKIRILLYLFIFSIIMTPIFELEAVSNNMSYTEKIFPSLMQWLRGSNWLLFFVTFGITTGFMHYWIERAIYRISDKDTSSVLNNLLFSK